MKEIELYQEYREKREQIQRGLTKGVAEGLIMPGEGFKKNINEVEDIMMELRNKLKYNN
jgi:hypothetical protein